MPHHNPPSLQPLEPRQLLAAGGTAFLLGNTLIVTGTRADDAIGIIHASPSHTSPINVSVNGRLRSFPAARVARDRWSANHCAADGLFWGLPPDCRRR